MPFIVFSSLIVFLSHHFQQHVNWKKEKRSRTHNFLLTKPLCLPLLNVFLSHPSQQHVNWKKKCNTKSTQLSTYHTLYNASHCFISHCYPLSSSLRARESEKSEIPRSYNFLPTKPHFLPLSFFSSLFSSFIIFNSTWILKSEISGTHDSLLIKLHFMPHSVFLPRCFLLSSFSTAHESGKKGKYQEYTTFSLANLILCLNCKKTTTTKENQYKPCIDQLFFRPPQIKPMNQVNWIPGSQILKVRHEI